VKPSFCALAALVLGATLSAQQQNSGTASPPPGRPSQVATTARPSPSQVDSSTSCLRVYRPRRYSGAALAPSIYVDDKQIARVGNGRRVSIRLTPGAHTIRSDDKSSAISLDAKSGQDYFIRIDEETGFWKGHGKLTLVLPEQGAAEYKLQKPVEETRKITKEMIVEESEITASDRQNGPTR
jgi:Protein of unknown function (DUF2846)